jgi:hypothetical protein
MSFAMVRLCRGRAAGAILAAPLLPLVVEASCHGAMAICRK